MDATANPLGNAFARKATRLVNETEAQRVAANDKSRVWRIASSERMSRLGHPTAFTLFPEGQLLLPADDMAPIRQRAAFATKHLWVTHDVGYTPNQHPGRAGLPAYTQGNRKVDGEDIVVWHTFGLTHLSRTEDWPMMPVDTTGFVLKPEGYFDRNPTLDFPEDPDGQCSKKHAS